MKKLLKNLWVGLALVWCTAATAEVKEWTVYVHLNGDNNLCSFAKKDVQEMKANDMSQNTNWIVAYDCSAKGDSKLMELKGKTEKILKTGEFDMGDWQFAADTAIEVFDRYPSKHKMIVMWNHGSGWRSAFDIKPMGVSYDDDSGNHITTVQMGEVMKQVAAKHHIDILGYDACLMAMVETGYETALYSDYIAASEETEPGDGWNYVAISSTMLLKPSPEKLGVALVDNYVAQYPSEATFSFVSTAGLMELIKEIDLMAPFVPSVPNVLATIKGIQGYAYPENKDLGTFLDKLPKNISQQAKSAYSKAVIYNRSNMIGTGLAILLIDNPSSDYGDLNFAKDFHWYEMLKALK